MVARIVLDTNVIISAFGWKGSPHKILQRCVSRDFQLYCSLPLFHELSQVLRYAKFAFTSPEISEFLSLIVETAVMITTDISLNVVTSDPSDNRLLECALAAQCDYIITGDRHLLALKKFEHSTIITPGQFLKLF